MRVQEGVAKCRLRRIANTHIVFPAKTGNHADSNKVNNTSILD